MNRHWQSTARCWTADHDRTWFRSRVTRSGPPRLILGGVNDPGPTGPEARPARAKGPVVAAVVWAVVSAGAFVALDAIVAAFVCILGLTAVVMAFFSSDWVRSTTFEEREAERVRRRKAKWDAGAAARERDRARWEAHQARKAAGPDPTEG
jgi:hypothetical protein